jgi:hypothetical protein
MHICLHSKTLSSFYHFQRPFRGNSNEALSKAIAYEELKYPDNATDILSPACIDVISNVSFALPTLKPIFFPPLTLFAS